MKILKKQYTISNVTCGSLKDFNIKNKRQVIRNQVNYEIGKHILDSALNTVEYSQGGLF